jgi:hypothetical protein
MFPEGEAPFKFGREKPVVVVSARVHPGETPSSHVMNGLIQGLMANGPVAEALRDRFVWMLVPFVNPDGVARGHYRMDSKGVNLNRCYICPKQAEHNPVFAIKRLVEQLSSEQTLFAYLDLHAHAGRKGCFIFGNYSKELATQTEICLFARLLALNSPLFDYDASNFTEANMYYRERVDSVSKEGTGRVAFFKKTKNPRCWTLECNYNMGRFDNLPALGPALEKVALLNYLNLPKQ